MRPAALVLAAVLLLPCCSRTLTTVRTITPENYAEQSWIGHTADEVALAWGENGGREPDGSGGRVLTYRKIASRVVSPANASGTPAAYGGLFDNRGPDAQLPRGGSEVDVVAKFWIGADGKVYRYWFADEVYKKRLDTPSARPVETYNKTR